MQKSRKVFGASLSVGLNSFLILLKLVVGVVSGSVGVLASAIDSFIDLVSSLFAFFAIHIAETPPDSEHPFGHGKFEDFAGLIEAILIMLGALFIIGEAFSKIASPMAYEVEPVAGIAVMVFALVLDFIISRILFRIARETDSSALLADAYHLSTDVWSSLAVIAGLVLVKFTGNHLFDPLMALVVAGMILGVGARIVRRVFKHLVDTALPAEEESRIVDIIHQTIPSEEDSVAISDLKTRRSGSHRLIVFNLLVPPQLSVQKAHEHCDRIEEALRKAFPNSLVTIHIEPQESF